MRASSKNGADDGERKEGATSLTAAFDAKTPFAKVGDGTNREGKRRKDRKKMTNENLGNLSEEQRAAVGDKVIASLEEHKKLAGDEQMLRYIDRKIEEAERRWGRKPKSPRKRRDKVVHVRFNADEYEMLQKYQEADGDDMAVLVRELAVEGLYKYFEEQEIVRSMIEARKKGIDLKPAMGHSWEALCNEIARLKREGKLSVAPEEETSTKESETC